MSHNMLIDLANNISLLYMVDSCPVGFLCLNSNSALLLISVIFIVVAYLATNGKVQLKKMEDYTDLITAKEIVLEERRHILNKLIETDVQALETSCEISPKKPISSSIVTATQLAQEPVIINNIYVQGENRVHDRATENMLVSKEYERLVNPLLPPERSYETTYGLPINVPTRGVNSSYQQIGTLDSDNKVLPLFGRPMWRGSHKWNFYTFSDQFHAIKLPVHLKSRDCMDDTIGCDELYTGDSVTVPQYPGVQFRVNMYKLDKPTYIPFV